MAADRCCGEPHLDSGVYLAGPTAAWRRLLEESRLVSDAPRVQNTIEKMSAVLQRLTHGAQTASTKLQP